MQNRAYKLMKLWCDTLLSYQVQTNTPYTNNALLCPACHVIHGRIADLCFPLTVIWAKTKNAYYLEQADRLIDWSEYNLKNEEGLWYNDVGNHWYGTSAFSAMAMGEAIEHFGQILPETYKSKWMKIFIRMADTVAGLDTRKSFTPPSNYYCGIATMLALAWKLTGNTTYYEKSKYWVNTAISRFDKEGILYGEGPVEAAGDGSHAIDMGYNLEESLPLLLRYAQITGEHMQLFRQRLRDQLAFLLPDGGIDNSFGSRHNKWTYWGSRTSDGLIEGLALVLDDPLFANACERVLSLYESCTRDGLLAMPMAWQVNEPTCLHHTFPHAKALAALVCAPAMTEVKKVPLPWEAEYGIKAYQNGRLLLLSKGGFRATFSAVQAKMLPEYAANGGGSMNLLYHKDYGVICAATSAEYVPSEPLNQQYLRNSPNPPCMTAQFVVNGQLGCYENVQLTAENSSVIAQTQNWRAKYSVTEQGMEIALACENGIYNLPVVCPKESCVAVSADGCIVTIDGKLTIRSTVPLLVDCGKRIFHQVGGLLYLPVSVAVQGEELLCIRCTSADTE